MYPPPVPRQDRPRIPRGTVRAPHPRGPHPGGEWPGHQGIAPWEYCASYQAVWVQRYSNHWRAYRWVNLGALSSLRGLRGAPEVPPLCQETSVSRTANVGTVGMNGLGLSGRNAARSTAISLTTYWEKLCLKHDMFKIVIVVLVKRLISHVFRRG